jgi:hypothetical protein
MFDACGPQMLYTQSAKVSATTVREMMGNADIGAQILMFKRSEHADPSTEFLTADRSGNIFFILRERLSSSVHTGRISERYITNWNRTSEAQKHRISNAAVSDQAPYPMS